ncbi:type I-F CRISPR-associated protein Csy2 [Candidatus Halobeggiatoa sp. HSG11]|nr:type I-F CRISPR-associated protein Csy2 [Candidatus Halobeggiatoa sp. HSG11]
MATYIVYRNMEVINCNLSSSYLTADLSQNAYIGFAHNLARYLDKKLPEPDELSGEDRAIKLGSEKVFSIIKQLEFYQGNASLAGHLNENNHKALNIPMNPPEIKGSLQHTIVISLDIAEPDEISLIDYIRKFVLFNRFAGGDIQVMADDNIKVYQNDKDLQEALKTEKGWLVQDATDELVEEAKNSNYSKAFNNFLATFVELDENGKKQYKRRKGWYFASLSGYQLLENPRKRIGVRVDDCPHAFAEPIIGLHELVYYRQQDFNELFWQAKMLDNSYLVKQVGQF